MKHAQTSLVRRGTLVLVAALLPTGPLAAEVSFNNEIRPLLSDRCFACHGPDGGKDGEGWKGGLRLDTKENAFADLVTTRHADRQRKRAAKGLPAEPRPEGSRFAIVPGKPEESLLVDRITSRDPDEVMPPPDSHLSLSNAEQDLLVQWIAEGARWDEHWAFVAPKRPPLPVVDADDWPRTDVDHFVLSRLETRDLHPAPPTGRHAWLRRVTFDLTGLPPTLTELKAFAADQSPDAEARVVDRLLASDAYAERMTALWLDNARYADSNGYQFDNARTMWPWRDWVLAAYRTNMPWDQFVTKQLAGDLLPEPTRDDLIATGFNRNHGYSIEGGIIDEEYRVLYANDKTTTAGTLFLGLTFDCARCHDHKYDPLTMEDYYSFYAFFNTSAEKGAPGEAGRKEMAAAPFLLHPAGSGAEPAAQVMIMKEEPRKTFLLEQGLYDQPGREVTTRTPAFLPGFGDRRSDRLGLAQWLTTPENPLFARVTVNRLWQQFFGAGLVSTPDNFGVQGARPTHPLLLDWLAADFRESRWDLHHLIRTIVLSATYRQDSRFRPELQDPANRHLARGPTFRLPAEMIRDQALAVSGLLDRTIGGPSVKPYQPEGVWGDLNAPKSHAEVYQEDTGPALHRRSLYTYWRRAVPHPAMLNFDAPSRDVCSVKRETTNTPLQALVTLHGPTYLEASRKLAERCLVQEAPLAHAFRTVLSRSPEKAELDLLRDVHRDRLAHYKASPGDAANVLTVGATPADPSLDPVQLAALADVCHVLLNLSETITRK